MNCGFYNQVQIICDSPMHYVHTKNSDSGRGGQLDALDYFGRFLASAFCDGEKDEKLEGGWDGACRNNKE